MCSKIVKRKAIIETFFSIRYILSYLIFQTLFRYINIFQSMNGISISCFLQTFLLFFDKRELIQNSFQNDAYMNSFSYRFSGKIKVTKLLIIFLTSSYIHSRF